MLKTLKTYESFIKQDQLYNIIKQLENRIKYWFGEKGTLSKDMTLTNISVSPTTTYSYRSIIIDFYDDLYVYQTIFLIRSDSDDECEITIKRYEPSSQELIDQIDDNIKIDKIKENYIILKISEFSDKNENPDKNKIEVKKDEVQPQQQQQNNDNSWEEEF
jgi:hypothetical protein